jgi:hypothetical protein
MLIISLAHHGLVLKHATFSVLTNHPHSSICSKRYLLDNHLKCCEIISFNLALLLLQKSSSGLHTLVDFLQTVATTNHSVIANSYHSLVKSSSKNVLKRHKHMLKIKTPLNKYGISRI